MIAITNTTLVAVVTQPRILYGMANEDVVPGVFGKIHADRRSPWVGLLFSGVVVSALLVVGTVLTEAGSGLDLVARLATVTVLFLLFIYAPGHRLRAQAARAGRGREHLPRQHPAAVRRAGRQPRHPGLVGVRRPGVAAVVCGPGRPWASCCSCSSTSSAARTGPRAPSGATPASRTRAHARTE